MTLDPTLLSRLSEMIQCHPNSAARIEFKELVPMIRAHIEAQDKRLSAVSGLVEALELIIKNSSCCCDGIQYHHKHNENCDRAIARAALAAWRKNHEV